VRDISDLSLIFQSPRSFFGRVASESGISTVRRLLLYGVLFDLLTIVLFLPMIPSPEKISLRQLLLFGTLETLIAVFPGLLLSVTTRLLDPKPAIKVVIAYAVVCKFVMLTPAVVFFALYLLGESVALLAAKGVVVWFASLALPLSAPFLLSTSSKRRLLTAFLSLLLLIGARIGLAQLVIYANPFMIDKLSSFSFLIDPVGLEISRYKLEDMIPKAEFDNILKSQKDILEAVRIDGKSANIDQFRIFASTTTINLETEKIASYANNLKSQLPAENLITFQTTKEIIKALREDLDSLASIADAARIGSPLPGQDITGVLSTIGATSTQLQRQIEVQNRMVKIFESQIITRYKLRKWLLAVW